MKTFVVRDCEAADMEWAPRRIRRMLENRQAMCIGELCQRLGMEEDNVRAELETMKARGEVERLRPVDYIWEDQDFFRLCGGDRNRDGREWVQLAGEATACVLS
jgi:hypothetical protein